MLTGVLFRRTPQDDGVQPEFVNQFILTDVFLSAVSTPGLRSPVVPSIATLVNPASSFLFVLSRILRTLILVILSHITGSLHTIRKISVANTAVLYHDGRALATCESGPLIRIQLPGLETVGWYDGCLAEGEPDNAVQRDSEKIGGTGMMSWMREWTTGHPKVDPVRNEMVLYHCYPRPPFVRYSVIPADGCGPQRRLVNEPVPNVSGSKMMHDFGVSLNHTVIIDLPLSLELGNMVYGKPSLLYDPSKPSRFGVFPRHDPKQIKWFETTASCIFHTANTWDTMDENNKITAVNLLACRLTSAAMVFRAGNLKVPEPKTANRGRMSFLKHARYTEPGMDSGIQSSPPGYHTLNASDIERQPLLTPEPPALQKEDGECRLYYYCFDMQTGQISTQYALSAVTFEFPSVRRDREMQAAQYVYGCSSSQGSFGAALGRVVGINVLVKFDVFALISRGRERPPPSVTGCVDQRTTIDVLTDRNPNDPIQCFRMPDKWFAQEPKFVPRTASASEDDGFLLFYAFDEGQLDAKGECKPDAVSELWIIDAKSMCDVVARVALPQRVPYGLHGNWFPESQIAEQRTVQNIRQLPDVDTEKVDQDQTMGMRFRRALVSALG